MEPTLVLASASPRRRELLHGLGYSFEVRPAEIDESPHPDEGPEDLVERLARTKALAAGTGGVVLAADTIVAIDGRILGKPADEAQARAMLRDLAGRRHRVLTGVAVHSRPRGLTHSRVVTTVVTFATLSEAEIDWYVASGEPLDKAGAYAIQGRAALFVTGLEGSHSNVVGLPLRETYELLAELGCPLPGGGGLSHRT